MINSPRNRPPKQDINIHIGAVERGHVRERRNVEAGLAGSSTLLAFVAYTSFFGASTCNHARPLS
jgi:hypothetical protein